MAKWQIIDTDLITTNIAEWVEIFGVTWDYINMTLDPWLYYLWSPAMSWDLWSSWYTTPRWDLRFYDDWTKIIIMWCSIHEANWASFSQFWWAYYYAEILKSTWVITVYPEYVTTLWTSTPYWNYKMVNISWSYYYTWAPNDSSNWFVVFNWTAVVSSASKSAILAASNIWSSSISYRWRTLQKATIISMEDTLFYWAWWACLQMLQYG